MGRYYYGNISGKYWFAIQSTGCMCNYGAYSNPVYEYKCCHCEIEDKYNPYCIKCYTSLEEHKKDVLEENEDEDEDVSELYEETSYEEYCIDRDDFEEFMKPVIEKHREWFNSIAEITFEGDTEIEYDVELKKRENDIDNIGLLADYCMMLQIQKWFDKNDDDTCEWYGEC